MTETTTEQTWYDPEATTFGDRMAGAREASGMSQAQLARRLGVKEKTIEKWENDLSEPRANRLSMLAGLLNVSILWLISGDGDAPDVPGEATATEASLDDLLRELRQVQAVLTRSAARIERLETQITAVLEA
ncbi:helix-turn-helix domain-containing protein [Roseovarius sp. C7]|uniref:helix-turn-helix domain-containing protein n=1 Tax=Roseovarius sp. C7 TaxID=3398643 RepID=UPI0039F50C60